MYKTILICLFLLGLFSACGKDDSSINFEKDESMEITLLDTFTIQASTILLDSIPTSGTGIVLLGKLNDIDFGKIESSSYFPLKAADAYPEFNVQAKFDSLKLSLEYAGYHYGDTSKHTTIGIFQLTEEVKLLENPKISDPDESSLLLANNMLYNNSKIGFSTLVLGSIRFKPKPRSKDSINVKLSSSFGANLFAMIYEKDPRVVTNDEFVEYFKGIALVPSGDESNSMTGFKTSSLKMRLYYSEPNASGIRVSKNIVFSIADSLKQFNKISSDRSSTTIKDISYANKETPLSNTANRGYIQAGIGLATKIKLPYILSFLHKKSNIINKAELVIDIPTNPFNYFSPPSNLNLMIANKKNRPQEVIRNPFEQGDQFAVLQNNYADVAASNRYVFNVTEYLDILKKTSNNGDASLLLSVPISRLNKSFERTMTGGPGDAKANIKLKIIYTQFKLQL